MRFEKWKWKFSLQKLSCIADFNICVADVLHIFPIDFNGKDETCTKILFLQIVLWITMDLQQNVQVQIKKTFFQWHSPLMLPWNTSPVPQTSLYSQPPAMILCPMWPLQLNKGLVRWDVTPSLKTGCTENSKRTETQCHGSAGGGVFFYFLFFTLWYPHGDPEANPHQKLHYLVQIYWFPCEFLQNSCRNLPQQFHNMWLYPKSDKNYFLISCHAI